MARVPYLLGYYRKAYLLEETARLGLGGWDVIRLRDLDLLTRTQRVRAYPVVCRGLRWRWLRGWLGDHQRPPSLLGQRRHGGCTGVALLPDHRGAVARLREVAALFGDVLLGADGRTRLFAQDGADKVETRLSVHLLFW